MIEDEIDLDIAMEEERRSDPTKWKVICHVKMPDGRISRISTGNLDGFLEEEDKILGLEHGTWNVIARTADGANLYRDTSLVCEKIVVIVPKNLQKH